MLFSAVLFLIFLIIAFLYFAAKLEVKLENSPYKKIFYVLLFISFITVIEIIFCFYLYIKFRTKDGEEGPRGFQGHPGDKGDKGKCNDNNCKQDVIKIMIQKIFEKKLGRILTNEERNKVLSINLQTNVSANVLKTSTLITDLNLAQIKLLHEHLTNEIELGYLKIDSKFDKKIKDIFT